MTPFPQFHRHMTNTMKKMLPCLVLGMLMAICPSRLMAQNAVAILDQCAEKLKSNGGLQAHFSATNFKKTTEQGTTQGTIDIQQNAFKMQSPQMTVWFDGTTQWTMLTGSDEVNVTRPTAQELQNINPYSFVSIYKEGYKASLSGITYNGHKCHNIRLTANSKGKNIQEMRIVIDPATLLPQSIRIRQKDGNWLRLRVSQIQLGKKWDNGHFRFSEKDHPQVEVIDLR